MADLPVKGDRIELLSMGQDPHTGVDRKPDYFYFVKFDDFPHPVGLMDWKIGREEVF